MAFALPVKKLPFLGQDLPQRKTWSYLDQQRVALTKQNTLWWSSQTLGIYSVQVPCQSCFFIDSYQLAPGVLFSSWAIECLSRTRDELIDTAYLTLVSKQLIKLIKTTLFLDQNNFTLKNNFSFFVINKWIWYHIKPIHIKSVTITY